MYVQKERRKEAWLSDFNKSDLVSARGSAALRLRVSPPVDDVSPWRGDVDRVQDRPQNLAERSGDRRKRFDILNRSSKRS